MLTPQVLADLMLQIDRQRADQGFLSIHQLLRLGERGNIVLAPFSTLIAAGAQIGSGNIFYPGVVVEIRNSGSIEIGDNNRFSMLTYLLADAGQITIGSHNEFGDGGASVKALGSGDRIAIGDHGRYTQGAQIAGSNTLGSGSQILGPIIVQGCTLGAGESFLHPDPDLRGAVLKGAGIARGVHVGQGEVISRRSSFDQADIERQTVYHPKS
ncbi:MAG TPA: hypothetical protein VFX76_13890 [Roseiflexaceae bacterium]|nr:hypothetical protein [Roseiflexaceae bacterium]